MDHPQSRCSWATAVFVSCVTLASAGCAGGVPQAKYDAAVSDAAAEKRKNEGLERQLADTKAQGAKSPPPPSGGPTDAEKAEIEELKKQKAAAEARAKTMDDFVKRFRKMIDAGKLEITVRHGQIVLALDTEVLFEPGKTDVKAEGKTALKEIGDAIKSVPNRRFQVAGHTDTTPIKTKEFPSNWELSTERAVVVVKLLIAEGVQASTVSAAGFAEFDPVGNNATPEGRAKNRRIEIILLPHIDELFGIAGLTPGKAGPEKSK
jgi:flagellar motor protein MotB